MLMAAISLRLFVTVALITHFVPILVWRGMSQTTGAYLVSLYALGTIFVTLAMGWFGDRRSKAVICSLGLMPMILVMSGVILSPTTLVLYLYPIGLAIAMGTAAQNWALIGDFFGRRNYATVRGLMGVSYGTTSFLSPIYAGVVFDRTGSYTFVLVSLSMVLLITVCLFARLRPPPPKNERGAPRVGLNS
jgi:MFS family permease